MRQLHEAVHQGSEQSLEIRCLGTIDELTAEIKRRKATAQSLFDYIALQFAWTMVTGKGKMHQLDNHRYPRIRHINVANAVATMKST